MSRVVKVANGDYKIQVSNGGTITLDTQAGGSGFGNVLVKGNLDVIGTLSYIETTNTQISDNIFQLNVGQGGSAITGSSGYPGQAGIQILRGSSQPAAFTFNENVTHWDQTSSTNKSGTFEIKTTDVAGTNSILSGIALQTITNAGGSTDIVFDLQNTTKVLTIANGSAYAANVSRLGDIPNVEYLQNYVSSNYNGTGQGTAIVNSLQYPLSGSLAASQMHVVADATTIKSYAGTHLISTLADTGVTFGYVQVGGYSTPNQISNTSGNNLILTSINNRVEVSAVLGLDNQGSAPTYTNTGNTVYSVATPGPGKTGLFFVNSVNYNDELVAKNRALLLSILF